MTAAWCGKVPRACGGLVRSGNVADVTNPAFLTHSRHYGCEAPTQFVMMPSSKAVSYIHTLPSDNSGRPATGERTVAADASRSNKPDHQRTVILMCDGFGSDYYAASPTPTLKRWAAGGVFAQAKAVMPSVTNANNTSICCGTWPATHGIIGNSFLDEKTGAEEYMESADLLLAPTLFERAARHGVRSGLLTSKKKTTALLGRGAEILLAAESPSADWEAQLGAAPPIYSREINYWLMRAAIQLLTTRPEIGV